MITLSQKDAVTQRILGEQTFSSSANYRPLFYLHCFPYDGGQLVYNTLTAQAIFLSAEESAVLNGSSSSSSETAEKLVKDWFLVPTDFDDKKFAKQFSDMALSVNRIYTRPPINSFVIFPTTDCNARCFYCYELGNKRRNMTEQTAHDVADFIERRRDPSAEKVTIRWFGGEPLYNVKAIDIICEDLRKKGIAYRSKMISNSYLFDDEMVGRAVDLWHLDWIQVTLDGTEEIYNRTKAFIYKDGTSAFKRVTDNIERLLKAGIRLQIRMNMDDHNSEDLFELSRQMIERFGKYNNFRIYSFLLFEDSCARIQNRADDDRHGLIEKQVALQKFIQQKTGVERKATSYIKRTTHCMADSDRVTTILPDGQLGKCEHYLDDHFWGSIYSDEVNFTELNWFKQTGPVCDDCENCNFRPMCLYPQCCCSMPHRCDDFDKLARKKTLVAQMVAIYNKYKKEHES